MNENVVKVLSEALNVSKESVKYESLINGGMTSISSIYSVNGKKYAVHEIIDKDELFVDSKREKGFFKETKLSCIQTPIVINSDYRIFEYIDGEVLGFNNYKENLEKVAISLKELHSSKKLGWDYKPFEFIEKMLKITNTPNKEDFTKLYNYLLGYKDEMESREKCPSHNDMQFSNLIAAKDSVKIIDFEFAADNDYLYDIATFGNNDFKCGLELLDLYSPNPSNEEKKMMLLWRIFIDCQWYMVAKVKHELGFDKALNLNFLDIADFFLNQGVQVYNYIKENL